MTRCEIRAPSKITTASSPSAAAARGAIGTASITSRACRRKTSARPKLSANIATIPPGGVAYAHIHVGFELILYILEGRVRHEFGSGLKQTLENEAGDFIYIKPGVPHEVFNMSDTEPVVAFVARSSADEWDNIVPYDRHKPSPA